MSTEEYIKYHDHHIENREKEVNKALISVRLSTLKTEHKLNILRNLKNQIEQEYQRTLVSE